MHSAIGMRGRAWLRATAVVLGATALITGPLPGMHENADAAPPKPMLGRCMDKYGTSATPPPSYKLPGYKPAGLNEWKTPNAEDRFYSYDNLAQGYGLLKDPAEIHIPEGKTKKDFEWGSPENAKLTWEENQAGDKKYPGTFNEWLNNVYSRNEGNNKRGNAFESEVVKYFDLGGVDWLCQKNLKDINPDLQKELEQVLGKQTMKDGRVFDAVNQRTKTVYEIKSGIDKYDARQIKIDAELVKRGWKVVYITGQAPDAGTIAKYREAGVNYYRHGATPNPRFETGKWTPRNANLLTPDPNKPSFGSGTNVIRQSPPNPNDVRRMQERANPFIRNAQQNMRSYGGIDFSTLDLSYIGQTKTGNVSYAFSAKNVEEGTGGWGGKEKAQLINDAFFTWLALTPDHFWVNLNPDDPNTIMKAPFDKTDAGRVLLQADMEMKRDFGRAEDPKTDAGKRFWNEISKVDGKPCMGSTRNWITPKKAVVRMEDDGLYILDAPLEVKTVAQDYATQPAGGMPCKLTKAQTTHNMDVYRRALLPVVEKQVNTDPKYADLRRVYKARIGAEYVRQTVTANPKSFGGSFNKILNSNNVKRWPLRGKNADWDKMTVWREMKKSYTEGDFKYEIPVGGEVWVYTVGGVDLTKQPQRPISQARFHAEKPNLPSVTLGARNEVLGYQDTGTTLIGGDNSSAAGGTPTPHPTPTPTHTGGGGDKPTTSPTHTPGPTPIGGGHTQPPVTPPADGDNGSGGLADTGTQVLGVAGIAVALLAAGAALVWWKRRRNADS
ncbi:LPXTG cell wall anchor domain-containing protein [Streptomyces sp. NPDC001709]